MYLEARATDSSSPCTSPSVGDSSDTWRRETSV